MAVNLFDAAVYSAANPDLAAAGLTTDAQLRDHFNSFGLQENRKFSLFVDLGLYRSSNSDLANFNNAQLLDHLQNFGVAENRKFSPYFSSDVYLAENADLVTAFTNSQGQVNREAVFNHLQEFGLSERRRFAPGFDINFYASNNADLGSAGLTTGRQLLQHYEFFGVGETRRGADVLIGGRGDNLTGVSGGDRFKLIGAGANITNFETGGTDTLEIVSNNQPLTYFDLISRFNPLIRNENGATVISTPTPHGATTLTSDFVTLQGVGAASLVNSPDSFVIHSQGNTVIDWNEVLFDAARIAGVPPAASTRYFAIVQTAIQDAVQGILADPKRNTYLQSIGQNLPTLGTGVARDEATASIAAAYAAERVLNRLFTDPDNQTVINFTNNSARTFTPQYLNNGTAADGTAEDINTFFPRIFTAALNTTLSEFNVSDAVRTAARTFGETIGQAIVDLRTNDGAFRDANGVRVNPADFESEYLNGIEPEDAVNEVGGQDQQTGPTRDGIIAKEIGNISNGLLNDGTVGRLSDGTDLRGTGAVTTGGNFNSPDNTTPGAWRRGEDTLRTDGTYAPLASPEFADINTAWVLPTTNFFNDNVIPPPALDSERYRDNVAEVRAEGSLLDLPVYGTNTDVSVTNRTTTVDGVTTIVAGSTVLGTAINDTNTAEVSYGNGDRGNDFGLTRPDGIGTTSAERTVIGHVWANAEGTYGPNYAWQKVAQQLAVNNKSSLADTAYVLGSLNVALADGFINIWDMKWDEDYFWRPVSSVRNADQLTATASLDDNSWTPREGTPQHPCHPSGTSLTAGIASVILANFYGDNQTFTVGADAHPNSARLQTALTSLNGNDRIDGIPLERVSRTYTSLAQAADESRTSRIYAGAHFRFATESGVNLGEQVARYFLRENPFALSQTI